VIGPWRIPEGLRVLPGGSWRIGDLPVAHEPSLAYLKRHLVFEDDGRPDSLRSAGRPPC